MKRLTKEQAEARIEMYNEAATHLELLLCCENAEEKKQAEVVSKQIRQLSKNFEKKFYKV